MKKFLIIIFPLCVILFILMWSSCELMFAIGFFSMLLLSVALAFGFAKWLEFVDKHIKD